MPVNIIITGLKTVLTLSSTSESIPVPSLKKEIGLRRGVGEEDYYLVKDGQILSNGDRVEFSQDEVTTIINAFPRILGGKGGFGSLIRAMGKSTQKSQNTEACRDLSGRRMRDVSTEKKLAEWIKDAAEKKKEVEEEKKARRERRRAGPKHVFTDHEYMDQIQANAENIDDALKQGLAASSSSSSSSSSAPGTKRPSTVESSVKPKKLHLWSGIDDLSDEELDEESEENHYGGDNEGTSRELPSAAAEKVEADYNETDVIAKSSDNGPDVVSDVKTEDNKVTKSASLSPDSSEDKNQEIIDEKVTEINGSTSDDKSSTENTATSTLDTFEPIDLKQYATAEELIVAVTPEHLKVSLQKLGLKCGGTPAQRGERLFATKGKSLSELDPSMFAKPKKQKK